MQAKIRMIIIIVNYLILIIESSGMQLQTTLLSVSCQVSANFGTCTAGGLNGRLVEAKMFRFTLECTHFIFDKCPI